jgi:UDPglucose--hexose-1-phosphate uridylyltransferase
MNGWEQRWRPLREEWVIIAAHRQERPWHGERLGGTASSQAAIPEYAADCYLCPGNPRVSGARNHEYRGIYFFDNDHPCVGVDAPRQLETPLGIYRNRPASGIARVLCYSPKHNLTLAELAVGEIENLIAAWRDQYIDLGSRTDVKHALIFENKGEIVGVSNPHPHCQIYATNFVFKTIESEARVSRRHRDETGRSLFQDIIKAEGEDGRRIIYENSSAIAFMPYFARYAYECYVAPKETHPGLADLSKEEIQDLAAVLKQMTVRYDNLWQMPFPYVMTLHHAPLDGEDHSSFHFHIEFHPPLRKPNLLKYLAGPNLGHATSLKDIVLAVQTEIPLVKQHLCDQLWAAQGQGAHAERYNRLTGERRPVELRPSRATTIAHGFAMISRFFPGAREELAAIDEEIVMGALGPVAPGKTHCFEDQYLSSGGQLYELIAGHYRFVADLRPLMQQLLAARGTPLGLRCLPYDLCSALIATEMGVIITDAAGRPLDAPLNVEADVAWAGYANEGIRGQIEPLLQSALRKRGWI